MKTSITILTMALSLTGGAAIATAQTSAFTYQGRLYDGTNPANGQYEILFRPFGVFTGGAQLTIPNIRFVTVSNGLFTTSMDFGPTIFDGGAVYLQLEVRTNAAASYSVLAPRQSLTAAPYSIYAALAANVPNGAIGSSQLANVVGLGGTNANGRLDVYRTANGAAAISLIGAGSQISAYGSDGQEKVHLAGGSWGQLFLNNGRPSNERSVTLGSAGPQGGGYVGLADTNGATRLSLSGESLTGRGGGIQVMDANGTSTVQIEGAETTGTGAQLIMKQADGTQTIQLDAEAGANGGGYLRLYKGDGSVGLTLQADASGEGKVTTQVLQITGGSDLSEQFEIDGEGCPLAPGTLVCIDPDRPGRLIASHQAYDRTVAGVISGAGGVRPGMVMGQQGTIADGRHPVALSGRVFCKADISNGAIHPGDLLTTSHRPGHAMRVTDPDKARGAVIGKAMSSINQGDGLVLVLVSLQ